MMKKWWLFVVLVVMSCFFISCENSQEGSYTITFKQDGQTTIKKVVKDGEVLTDIPTPVTEAGYDVDWDVTDFSKIQDDYTVNAVKTAKTFTITYNFGEDLTASPFLSAEKLQETVVYNSAYTLIIPTAYGYIFEGWMYNGQAFEAGTYTFTADIQVDAVWSIDYDSPAYEGELG